VACELVLTIQKFYSKYREQKWIWHLGEGLKRPITWKNTVLSIYGKETVY
jgi:hypothetical protein